MVAQLAKASMSQPEVCKFEGRVEKKPSYSLMVLGHIKYTCSCNVFQVQAIPLEVVDQAWGFSAQPLLLNYED